MSVLETMTGCPRNHDSLAVFDTATVLESRTSLFYHLHGLSPRQAWPKRPSVESVAVVATEQPAICSDGLGIERCTGRGSV